MAAVQRTDGSWLSDVAQVAIQQGKYVGTVIHRRLTQQPAPQPFEYVARGDIAVIGRSAAVANVFGTEMWGWPAWTAWLLIHLMYIVVEFQSRIVVLVRWAFQYLTFRRGARLTGVESLSMSAANTVGEENAA